MCRKSLLIIIIVLFFSGSVSSQFSVTGNLLGSGNEALPYANVVLENLSKQTTFGTSTDDKGYFFIRNLEQGEYVLLASMVGYQTYSTNLLVAGDDVSISLPNIELTSTSTNLSEVVVTGYNTISEIKPSVIRYKASALISETGGTAGDILKNMPSVAMGGSPGHNRDIRYRGLGNAYTKVLINGRDIGLSGNNRETVLDQIPAGSISHIEIISVPGPEYQSEGINGLVNIVLKDNANYGTHGKVDVYAGNHGGMGGGFSISEKREKLNIFANYDFLKRSAPKPKDKVKTDLKDGAITQVEDSYEFENKQFINQSLRSGIEYNLRPKTKLIGEYVYGYQLEEKEKTLDFTRVDGNGLFKSAGQELKTENKPNHYHQLFSGLEHTFQNQMKLSVNFAYQTENQKKSENKTTYSLTKAGKWANFQPALENKFEQQKDEKYLWNAGISRLMAGNHAFNLGYSGLKESRGFNNTTDKFSYKDTLWTKSSNGFDNFKVTETTHAFYMADEYKFSFMKLRTGLRYETTQTIGNAITSQYKGINTYHFILPSILATINLDKTQYVTINFGRRVRRPGFKDLNPFVEQKEPTKISKGNPELKPELAWAYELGYLKNFKKFNVGANLFYRDIVDVIQKTVSEDDNNIITEQPENTGRAYVAGVEIMTTIKPVAFWQLTASYSHFNSKITSGDYQGDALKDQYDWSAKAISDFKFPKGWSMQISGNAVGPKISYSKEEGTIVFADLGIEKRILSNGVLTFRMSDVFDTLKKEKKERTDKSFTKETEYTFGQMFMLGLSWTF